MFWSPARLWEKPLSMNFKFEEAKGGSSSILKFIDKDSFYSCRGFKNTNTLTINVFFIFGEYKTLLKRHLMGRNMRKKKKN